jgi:hypothetical protein
MQIFATEFAIPSSYFSKFEVHTLENPKLAYQAGFDFFLGNTIGLSNLENDRKLRAWEALGFRNLTAYSYLKFANTKENMNILTRAFCGDLNGSMKWENLNLKCRQHLAYFQATGGVQSAINADDDLRAFLSDLSHGTVHSRCFSSQKDASKCLAWLADYGVALFSVPKESVKDLGSHCDGKFADDDSFLCHMRRVENEALFGLKPDESLMPKMLNAANTGRSAEKLQKISMLRELIGESVRVMALGQVESPARVPGSDN